MRTSRLSPSRLSTAPDAAMAGCVAVVLLGACLVAGYSGPAAVAAACLCVPLSWRSWHPLAVLGALTLASVAYVGLVRSAPVYVVPLALGLYNVAVTGSRRRTVIVGVTLVLPFVVAVSVLFSPDNGTVLFQARELLCQLGLALAVGEAVRSGRELLEVRRQRAELETRRRVGEERVRIAREVHDIVSHSLATISTQASVGAYLNDRSPEQGAKALAEIRDLSVSALEDLRHTVGTLRGDEGAASFEPTPSLGDLPPMVDRARRSGVTVALRMEGSPAGLPSTLQLAVFRIVQESLTNAMRHARGARVAVRIAVGDADVSVDVVDDGSGEPTDSDGGGAGLIGMRERAAALGGVLEAGVAPQGGFRIRAILPLEASG
jgi:signal transduction histidine kinase